MVGFVLGLQRRLHKSRVLPGYPFLKYNTNSKLYTCSIYLESFFAGIKPACTSFHALQTHPWALFPCPVKGQFTYTTCRAHSQPCFSQTWEFLILSSREAKLFILSKASSVLPCFCVTSLLPDLKKAVSRAC